MDGSGQNFIADAITQFHENSGYRRSNSLNQALLFREAITRLRLMPSSANKGGESVSFDSSNLDALMLDVDSFIDSQCGPVYFDFSCYR